MEETSRCGKSSFSQPTKCEQRIREACIIAIFYRYDYRAVLSISFRIKNTFEKLIKEL